MTKVKMEVELFSDWEHVGEDEWIPAGGLEGAVLKELITKAMARLEKMVNEELEKQLRAAISEKLDSVVKSRLEQEVDNLLAVGWPKTNRYGEPKGDPVSFKQRVSDALFTKDDYWNKSKVEQVAEAICKKHVEPVARQAKKKLEEQVDELLNKRFQELLRQSVGLK